MTVVIEAGIAATDKHTVSTPSPLSANDFERATDGSACSLCACEERVRS
jgi:hypothetical protein